MAGEVDVDALLDRISPELFNEWLAYELVEGYSHERVLGTLALGFSALANSWGAKTKPGDFIIKWKEAKTEKDRDAEYELKAQQQMEALRAIAGGM